jgi:hypothetical protein
MSKKEKTFDNPQTGNSSLGVVSVSLLQRAVEALDDYLNAGCKDTRANASDKAKQVYQEYYGKEYRNRNER